MYKNFVKLTALFALVSAFVLGGCANPFDSPKTGGGVPAEKGVVRVEIGAGSAARTAVAAAALFSRYEYWFAKGGGAAVEQTAVENVFELDPGQYTVTVKAFVAEDTEPAAQGTSAAFTIAAGADAGAVSVTLAPVVGEGEGTLAFTLSYPGDAVLESLTLTRLGGEESFDLMIGGSESTTLLGKVFSGEQAGLGAGYWLAQASLHSSGTYMTYAGRIEAAHIYKDVSTELEWVFGDSEFTAIPVVNAGDSGPGTLREALERSAAGSGATIFIDLPEEDRVITLASPLPAIVSDLTIMGNGATLTQSGIEPGANTQLLHTSASTEVKISRLHFKGGRTTTGHGAAIYALGNLSLESCIFSDNQTTLSANGGAVYAAGLTVLGCTFYNNAAYRGGAIYRSAGTVSLTGNLFFGNTARNSGPVVYGTVANIKSGGCNVSDSAAVSGSTIGSGSGYAGMEGDRFNVTSLPVSSVSFKPVTSKGAAGALMALPADYPTADFYGRPITAGGAAGAAQDLITGTGYALDYGVHNPAYGTVSSEPPPDENGFYSSGQVTLTAEAVTPGVVFSHWTVNGEEQKGASNPLALTMDAHKIVRAVFGRNITVSDSGDTAGSDTAVTLRYALTNAEEYDIITLPPGGTITLGSALPEITKSLTIAGNGAILTMSYEAASTSRLLYISSITATVKIRRLHFKGGRTTTYGGAIWNKGNLSLESCIFSDNQATSNAGQGGAVYFEPTTTAPRNNLTVLGCTFYNNKVTGSGANAMGGAIYTTKNSGVFLIGNLFFGNTASSNNVVGTGVSNSGYNVSDKASGNSAATGSGYSGANNRFGVIIPPLGPDSFKPVTDGAAAGLLPSPLPDPYPVTDFYGQPVLAGGAAGAVQTLLEGYSLNYSMNNTAFGSVTPNQDPSVESCFYTSGTNVTLTAAATGTNVIFSHWILDGKRQADASESLTLTMNTHYIVQAVFERNIRVNDSGDSAGSGSAITLRYALTNAEEGDIITLPDGGTITLGSVLPEIAKSITIAGNGATLTSNTNIQLLTINDSATTVKISRLRFSGGYGSAIYSRGKDLALESCVFDHNTTTTFGAGAAVSSNSAGSLTVLGCTFYHNAAHRGGAIYAYSSNSSPEPITLTGNLFFGNTATEGNVFYGDNNRMAVSGGYNVSDKADGSDSKTGSGYMGAAGDQFMAACPLSPLNFRPITGGAAAGRLPAPLPPGYPEKDFNGQTIAANGASGAIQTLAEAGYYLDYGASYDAYGTVTPSVSPREDGLYAPNTNVTLTATNAGGTFSHWTIAGETDTDTNPLSLTMGAHKIVRAVFARAFTVSNIDGAGTNEAPTLRYALTNAIDGDSVILPEGETISLTSTLPVITKSITIAGEGATLTWSATPPSSGLSNSSLLRINGAAVKLRISRLHFKGGKATEGAAIQNANGTLTLESCIFSNNEATNLGGGIYTSDGNVAVLGCTFYNNKAKKGGGVIYTANGTNFLTGNLFFGNTGGIGNVAYNYYNLHLESGGYNVSDYEDGYTADGYNPGVTNNPNGSGYAGIIGDLFGVEDIVFATDGDPTTKPSSSSNANLRTLTLSLPADFPAFYFDGTPRTPPATAGAVAD